MGEQKEEKLTKYVTGGISRDLNFQPKILTSRQCGQQILGIGARLGGVDAQRTHANGKPRTRLLSLLIDRSVQPGNWKIEEN